MSHLKIQVGKWTLVWKSFPKGPQGKAEVEVLPGNTSFEVQWKKDPDGIWLVLPDGLHGFDLNGEKDDEDQIRYSVSKRGCEKEWKDAKVSYGDEASSSGAAKTKAKAVRVRAQMPGKILRVLIQAGDSVSSDQPIAVMEAMKMENEIRSPQSGTIKEIRVQEGQAVETGADLIFIDPS